MDRRTIIVLVALAACGCAGSSSPTGPRDQDASVAPSSVWAARCGGADEDRAVAVDVDGSGEIYVGAATRSTSFDVGDASVACDPPCIALGAFDGDGGEVWSLAIASKGSAALTAMAADVAGGLIVAGDLFATSDLGGPPIVAPACTSASSPDVLLARYDNSGYFLWARRFGDCDEQIATALAIDGTNVVLGGAFRSSIDVGLGPIAALGARDLFVARFDAGGVAAWGRGFGVSSSTSTSSEIRALAVDEASDVLVAGSAVDVVDLGAGPLTPRGDRDVFVAKLDPNGETSWSVRFGDESAQDVASIAHDGAGGVVIAGVTHGSVDFGGGALNGDGIYVADLARDGTHRWSRLFLSPSASIARVRVDASGAVTMAGTFTGAIDFGGASLSSASSASSTAAFVVKLDASGAHVWSEAFVGVSDVAASDVAVDARGETIVFGSFSGGFDGLVDRGGGDLFLEKLAR